MIGANESGEIFDKEIELVEEVERREGRGGLDLSIGIPVRCCADCDLLNAGEDFGRVSDFDSGSGSTVGVRIGVEMEANRRVPIAGIRRE